MAETIFPEIEKMEERKIENTSFLFIFYTRTYISFFWTGHVSDVLKEISKIWELSKNRNLSKECNPWESELNSFSCSSQTIVRKVRWWEDHRSSRIKEPRRVLRRRRPRRRAASGRPVAVQHQQSPPRIVRTLGKFDAAANNCLIISSPLIVKK